MLGKAGRIRTAFIVDNYVNMNSPLARLKYNEGHENLDDQINKWCEENEEVDILDIKFSSYSEGDFSEGCGNFEGYYSALIIYRV